jgi:hypothetical protein
MLRRRRRHRLQSLNQQHLSLLQRYAADVSANRA